DRPEPERSPAPYGKTHLLPRAKNQKGQAAWRTPGTPDETSIAERSTSKDEVSGRRSPRITVRTKSSARAGRESAVRLGLERLSASEVGFGSRAAVARCGERVSLAPESRPTASSIDHMFSARFRRGGSEDSCVLSRPFCRCCEV